MGPTRGGLTLGRVGAESVGPNDEGRASARPLMVPSPEQARGMPRAYLSTLPASLDSGCRAISSAPGTSILPPPFSPIRPTMSTGASRP